MKRLDVLLSIGLMAMGGMASAQSTGSFSSPSTGSGAAGSSPVGTVLPYTVQGGSTAPTQPGHTITGDRVQSPPPAHATSRSAAQETEARAGRKPDQDDRQQAASSPTK